MLLAELEYQLDNSILTQRTLRLRIGSSDVEEACDRIATKLRDKVQASGFRKGRAPLARVRQQFWSRIEAEAFAELKQSALDQVLQRLEPADRPFLPPEVLERDAVKLRYGQQLEFAVKYLVDPSGISANPAQPEQGQVQPGAQVQRQLLSPPGIPAGPALPAVAGIPEP